MKKILLFSVVLFMTTFVYSQRLVDIGISMTSPNSSSVIRTGKPFSVSVTVTNNGPDVIKTSDTLYFFKGTGTTIDYQSATLVPITSNINSGASANFTIPNMVIEGASGGQFTLCSYMILYNGMVSDSVYDMNIDGNNRSCSIMDFSGASINGININKFSSNAYPNPVSDILNIEFIASKNSSSSIEIYDMHGRIVQTIDNGLIETGIQTVNINVANLSKGIYFYKIINGSETSMNKFVVD